MTYWKLKAPIYQALIRPILIMGGERENVILLACISLGLCTEGRDLMSLALSILIWMMGIMASKLVARHDPWATKIFIRSLIYQDFYQARERINTPPCVIKRQRKI